MHDDADTANATNEPQPRRGSALGALALLCSALGVAGCVTVSAVTAAGVPQAFFGLPATALLSIAGFVMGVIAFFTAEKGTPRGGIIGATFLGAIGATLQGGVVVGTLVQFLPIRAQVAPMVEEILSLHDAGDADAIRARLGEAALGATEEGDVVRFLDRVESTTGEILGLRIELGTMLRSREVMNEYPLASGGDTSDLTPAKPLEMLHGVDGADGFTLLGVWLDEAALRDERVLIDDLIAFLPDQTLLVLREGGPGWDLANQFSVRVITP